MKYTILYILLIISAVTLTACPGLGGLFGDKSSDDSSSSSNNDSNNNNNNNNNDEEKKAEFTFIPSVENQNLYITTTAVDKRQGAYKAKFSVTGKPDITVDGVYGQASKISALSGLTHGASYKLETISDGTGESITLHTGLEMIPVREKVKFTPYNGNTAGAGTYTLKVLGVTYTYDSTAGGFPNVFTHLKISGDVFSSTSTGEIVLDITSSKDVAWNYCDTATAKTCQIVYRPIPYTTNNSTGRKFLSTSDDDDVVTLNRTRTNTMALVTAGIESDEAVGTTPAYCLSYRGFQEERDASVNGYPTGGKLLGDRYINPDSYYWRFKQATVDKRPVAETVDAKIPRLNSGGVLYPHYLRFDDTTLTLNGAVKQVDVYRTNFDNTTKERTAKVGYCGSTRFKYYLYRPLAPSDGSTGGIVTESFTP